jgi:hypothetical protein
MRLQKFIKQQVCIGSAVPSLPGTDRLDRGLLISAAGQAQATHEQQRGSLACTRCNKRWPSSGH